MDKIERANLLADTKDLIQTLFQKGEELRTNAELRKKWNVKNISLQLKAKELTPEDMKEMEAEFQEWFGKNFPQIKLAKDVWPARIP